MGRKVPVYGRYGETTAAGDVCLTSEFVIKINFEPAPWKSVLIREVSIPLSIGNAVLDCNSRFWSPAEFPTKVYLKYLALKDSRYSNRF
jgi:hypothetical protein